MADNTPGNELADHQRRLRNETAFFALVALQNSGIKHDNKKSPARDFYFFGPTPFLAINDYFERERLFALPILRKSSVPFSG